MEGLAEQLEFDLTPDQDVKLDPIAETAMDLYRLHGGEFRSTMPPKPARPEQSDKNRHLRLPARRQ